jgi:plasmid maintenance system antidote protein VapI
MQGNLLRAEIAAQGLSCREVAERANISRSAFSAKINGQRPFDTDEAVRVCNVLGIVDNRKKVEIFLTTPSQ